MAGKSAHMTDWSDPTDRSDSIFQLYVAATSTGRPPGDGNSREAAPLQRNVAASIGRLPTSQVLGDGIDSGPGWEK